MRDSPNHSRTEREDQHTTVLGPADNGRRVRSISRQAENQDVGLDGRAIQNDPAACRKPIRDDPRVSVVVGKPVDVVIKGVQSCSGQNSGLSHGSAKPSPEAHATRDDVARSGELFVWGSTALIFETCSRPKIVTLFPYLFKRRLNLVGGR